MLIIIALVYTTEISFSNKLLKLSQIYSSGRVFKLTNGVLTKSVAIGVGGGAKISSELLSSPFN